MVNLSVLCHRCNCFPSQPPSLPASMHRSQLLWRIFCSLLSPIFYPLMCVHSPYLHHFFQFSSVSISPPCLSPLPPMSLLPLPFSSPSSPFLRLFLYPPAPSFHLPITLLSSRLSPPPSCTLMPLPCSSPSPLFPPPSSCNRLLVLKPLSTALWQLQQVAANGLLQTVSD